jgi:glycine betaine catabolism B
MSANVLAGDFTIPKNSNDKLIFIAGGIGITPFRSIIKNLVEQGSKKDIVMFYSAADPNEFVYKDIFKEAENFGVKTIYLLGSKEPVKSWTGETGYLTEPMIKKYAPDFKDRKIYLSGPVAMVNNYKNLFTQMGASNTQMVTDYFPGF